MSDKLSQYEADRLIALLKRCVDYALYIPSHGNALPYKANAVSDPDEIFTVIINRKSKLSDKCSFSLRYDKNNSILLRLDVGSNIPPHTNPDGTKVTGVHIHRYREGYDEKFAMAIDFDSATLEEDLLYFLNESNIEKPKSIGAMLKMES